MDNTGNPVKKQKKSYRKTDPRGRRIGTLVAALASGATLTDAGRAVGLSPASVHRLASRDDIRRAIDEQARALAALTPTAVDCVAGILVAGQRALSRELADNGQRTTDDYRPIEARRANDIRLVGYTRDAATTVLQTAGIAPTHMQAPAIQALIVTTEQALSPIIGRLLSASASAARERDIDPEWEDVTQDMADGGDDEPVDK